MMLRLVEVFSWLNYFDKSNLSAQDLFSLHELNVDQVPQTQKEGALRMLRINAESSLNELMRAEINANLGKYYYLGEAFAESIAYFNESVRLYNPKPHQSAVVNWLRGIVLWQTKENIKAHANWRVAIDGFEKIRDGFKTAKDPAKVMWYDRSLEQMKVEITQTAEEAYDWLNRWEQSSFDERSLLFVKEIEQRITKNDYPSAFEIGMDLRRISRFSMNPVESAETSVVIGMKYHRMGQAKLAIDYFHWAGSTFTPGHYQQAVTKWLLGAAQWDLRSEKENAFKSWRDSIDLFYDVMAQTNRSNDQKKRHWLENQINLMQKALEMKTKELLDNS